MSDARFHGPHYVTDGHVSQEQKPQEAKKNAADGRERVTRQRVPLEQLQNENSPSATLAQACRKTFRESLDILDAHVTTGRRLNLLPPEESEIRATRRAGDGWDGRLACDRRWKHEAQAAAYRSLHCAPAWRPVLHQLLASNPIAGIAG